MAAFQQSMLDALGWIMTMLHDMIGLFMDYPFMAFAMLAGLIYLTIDSLLMIFSGHGSGSRGKGYRMKNGSVDSLRSAVAPSLSGSSAPGHGSEAGSLKFSSGGIGSMGYSSAAGGKAFLKDAKAGHLKKKKKKGKGEKDKDKNKKEEERQDAFSAGYILGRRDGGSSSGSEDTGGHANIDVERDD